MQWLQWKQVKWEKNDPSTVKYECEHCSERFSEIHKGQMLAAGEWRPTAVGDGKTAGFHLSGLYSPLGWLSWADMVDDFLRAKSDAPLLKVFVNTRLSETWEEASANKVSANELLERVELYTHDELPDQVLLLTGGVDVQDNRLAVSVWGWGRDEESWLVYHTEVWGDPTAADVWKQLDSVLLATYKRRDGRELKVATTCIDSGGHCTGEVYQYARERQAQCFVAIKGSSQRGKPPIGKESKVDLNMKGRTIKKGASVYMVGGDTIKDTLLGRLRHNEPGPGYPHFGKAATYEYFDQLTAERKVTRYTRSGMPMSEYVKASNKRNEALDTAVYAYAALHLTYRRFNRTKIWEQLEKESNVALSAPKSTGRAGVKKSFVKDW
jgi:phage terminase large subunit GpA-like protein